jgi:hypothetical protein
MQNINERTVSIGYILINSNAFKTAICLNRLDNISADSNSFMNGRLLVECTQSRGMHTVNCMRKDMFELQAQHFALFLLF